VVGYLAGIYAGTDGRSPGPTLESYRSISRPGAPCPTKQPVFIPVGMVFQHRPRAGSSCWITAHQRSTWAIASPRRSVEELYPSTIVCRLVYRNVGFHSEPRRRHMSKYVPALLALIAIVLAAVVPALAQNQPSGMRNGDQQPAKMRDSDDNPAKMRNGDQQPAKMRNGDQQPAKMRDSDDNPAKMRNGDQQPSKMRNGDQQPSKMRNGDQQPAK
jgi:hypothetical protein